MRTFMRLWAAAPLLVLAGACATKPYDYTAFKLHKPRSILVLPPLNSSTEVQGSYSCLATVTKPIAEQGYYVFPVQVIDEMLKENGLPTPGEMHQASPKKIAQIINPDAILYLDVSGYGSKFHVVSSDTRVTVHGRLVHTKTGTLLWEGSATGGESSNTGGQNQGLLGMVVNAAVAQAINSSLDRSHEICRLVTNMLLTTKDHGLLAGPYKPAEAAKE
jgi:hypothetical protein